MSCAKYLKKYSNPVNVISTPYIITYIILGSILSGIGLLYDQNSVIIGSMLISPLSIPILHYVSNLYNNNYSAFLVHLGLLIILVLTSILIGFILSVINHYLMIFKHPSHEMISRANSKMQIFSLDSLIAFIAGIIAVVASFTDDYTIIAGIGIVVAFLPPLVNAGLYLGNYYSKEKNIINESNEYDYYNTNTLGLGMVFERDFLKGSITSFTIGFLNLLFFSIGAYLTLLFSCNK